MFCLDMLEELDGAVYLLSAGTMPRGGLDDVLVESWDLFLLLLCLVLNGGIAELILVVSKV